MRNCRRLQLFQQGKKREISIKILGNKEGNYLRQIKKDDHPMRSFITGKNLIVLNWDGILFLHEKEKLI